MSDSSPLARLLLILKQNQEAMTALLDFLCVETESIHTHSENIEDLEQQILDAMPPRWPPAP